MFDMDDPIMTDHDVMTIRQMCDAFGVTPRTLRFYEAKELLFPIRDGQKRLFTRRDRARLILRELLDRPEQIQPLLETHVRPWVTIVSNYIRRGKLWDAFAAGDKVVLLIDEIDKADLEFPNDLLHELDVMEFSVTETGDRDRAVHRPIVIITSNAEKELPDPFLRRCVFHFIAFPDEALMTEIVRVHHPSIGDSLLEQCLAKFYWLRTVKGLRKRPSTSELVDWIAAIAAVAVSLRFAWEARRQEGAARARGRGRGRAALHDHARRGSRRRRPDIGRGRRRAPA